MAETELTTIDRRALLAAAPAAVGAVALPAGALVAMPATEDPHIAWWHEWHEARRALAEAEAARVDDDDELEEPNKRCWKLEEKILKTKPDTLAGAMIVAAMLTWTVETVLPDPDAREYEVHGGMHLAAFLREIAPPELAVRAAS